MFCVDQKPSVFFQGVLVPVVFLLQSKVLMSSSAMLCGTWMMQKPTPTLSDYGGRPQVNHL